MIVNALRFLPIVIAITLLTACITPPVVEVTPKPTMESTSIPTATPPAVTGQEHTASVFDTILLYSTQTVDPAAPTQPTWGLQTAPAVPPFDNPVFNTIYGNLGEGENYPGYFIDFHPRPSPDGRYVLIPGIGGYSPPERPGTGLWLADLQEATIHQLMPTVPMAVWSPHSDAIAYLAGDTLYVRGLTEAATPQALFTHEELAFPFLAWSPDGQWLAVITVQQDASPQTQTLWVIATATGGARELTTLPFMAIEHVNRELTWVSDSQHLILQDQVISLDGNSVALGPVIRADGVQPLPGQTTILANRAAGLQLFTPDGALITTITTTPVTTWAVSPDGRRLAYVQGISAAMPAGIDIFDLMTQQPVTTLAMPEGVDQVGILHWNATGDQLYVDDGGRNSPIWSLPVAPTDQPTVGELSVVVEDGVLVEVLSKPGTDFVGSVLPAELTEMNVQGGSSNSPDGVWRADTLTALPKPGGDRYYTELRVKKVNGSVEWVPVATWSNFGLGYTTPQAVHWSPDGHYLYFTNAPVPDGCGLFVNASDLQRLNLADGTVTEVLPYGLTWSLAIAPNGKTVAYNKGDELYLLDLASSNVTTTKVEGLEPNAMWGNFVWSPDSQQLAFTIAYAPCQPPNWRHSIVVVDIQRMTMTTVIEKDIRQLTAITWTDASQIVLADPQEKQWILDLNAGTVTEASVLPTELNATLSPLPTASTSLAPTPVIIAATREQHPTFSQDLLFVNDQGIQYWNHRTNQIDTLAAPTLGGRPLVASIDDQQAKSGLPIGTITNLSVSTTGEKIAFARYTGVINGQDQYRIDLYERATEQTITLVSALTWLFDLQLSADGAWVAYLVQDTVWAVQTDGLSQPRPIGLCRSPILPEVNIQCTRQLIQSTDNQLAWADAEGLWVATMDENSAQLLAPNATIRPVSIKVYTPWAWSPGGQYLSTWFGHYEGSSQAIINSETKHVVEVTNSFEYINPGVRLTWLVDNRIALVRPAPLYEKTRPTLEFWSLRDSSNLQLHLDLSVTIPVASESIPTDPFQFTNGNLGFAVLNSHLESHLERGLFLWDQQEIRHVNDLPVSAENPVASGIARLSGQFYWLADGTGALLQELDIGYLLYIPMDGTPLYDLKPLMGHYVWGITWLPNR